MTIPRAMAAEMTAVMEPSSPLGALPAPKVSRMRPFRFGTWSTESSISGLMPGKILRHATCAVSRFVCMENLAMLVGRRIRPQFTWVPVAEMVAKGSQFGEAKAENEEAEILVLRLPR